MCGGGLALLHPRLVKAAWARVVGFCLVVAPFGWPIVVLFQTDDADDRASILLAVWPLVLIVAAAVALYELRRGLTVGPAAAVLSAGGDQWDRFFRSRSGGRDVCDLAAAYFAGGGGDGGVGDPVHRDTTAMNGARIIPGLAGVVGVSPLVGGGFYLASEERLSYAQVTDGPDCACEAACASRDDAAWAVSA